MYAQFFGLKHEPFSIAPDPRYLFMSERHREALAHLLYGVNGGGGFVLLSGEIGAGKTTVCRCFLEQVPRRCNVAYIFNPKLTVVELLKSICDEFHVPYEQKGPPYAQLPPSVKDYVDPLNEFLLRTHAVGQNNLLVIDEAQNLSAEVLEQLRLLTNLETNDRKLLQIILIGQPELRTMLARPELEQLAQRVIARFHLEALSQAESEKYIAHRLQVAGMSGALPFDREARRRIHELSRGIPRRINLLCDRALLGAYASGKTRVDRAIVEKAALEVFGAPAASQPQAASRSARERRVVLGAAVLAGVALAGVVGAAAFGVLHRSTTAVASNAAGASAAASDAARSASAKAAPAASSAGATLAGAAASASGPSSAASAAPADTPQAAFAHDPAELRSGLGAAARNEREAWRELAQAWGASLADGEPCLLALRQQLQCFRGSGSLASLRQLDRPVILVLRTPDDEALYAVMTGLTPQNATLRTADGVRTVSLLTLAQMWRGEFATLWRAPAGYRASAASDGGGAAASTWLAARLTALQGSPQTPEARDVPLKSRISAFQLTQGLKPDGMAGPMTYMQLN
ncbi:MAG TPA: AAA family ATPase, partial [Burkholderiaceae bacterium]